MAYLNKFNNQESLNNYIWSQEYSEPFVGYTADPYELIRYNITDVMLIHALSGPQKISVTPVLIEIGTEATTCPLYNNEYLQPFTSDGTILPERFCVIPQSVNNNTAYKIYELNGIEIAENPISNIFASTLILRIQSQAINPENYYKLFQKIKTSVVS